jgi:hypothetical protein
MTKEKVVLCYLTILQLHAKGTILNKNTYVACGNRIRNMFITDDAILEVAAQFCLILPVVDGKRTETFKSSKVSLAVVLQQQQLSGIK